LNSGLTDENFRGLVAVVGKYPYLLKLEGTDETDLVFMTNILNYNNYSEDSFPEFKDMI